MLKKLGIILGILIGALILIAVGALIGKYVFSQTPQAANQHPSSPSATPATNTPTTTPTTSPTLTNLPSESDKVDFALQITNINETGTLSRSITGEITNTGSIDAHNVNCKIEVYSNSKLININNGQSSISQALGTIKAGQTVTTTVDLTFGLFDGVSLTQNGATVNLQISSDEKTQVLSYDYKP